MVEGWCDLDHVHSDEVDTRKPPQHGGNLGRGQAAPDRRAGAGGICRIEGVYIEGQVGSGVAQSRTDTLDSRPGPVVMDETRVDPLDPEGWLILDPDTDLNRALGVDQAFPDGLVDDGPMIHPRRVIVFPGVGMRVELQQREWTVLRRMRPQYRQCDRMVPAQCQATTRTGENLRHMALDPTRNLKDLGIVESHVAKIGHGELVQRAEAPTVGWITCHQRRRFAQRSWPEPCARAVRHRLVERNAGHGKIDALQVLGQLAAQEGRDARKDVLVGKTPRVFAGDSDIDFIGGIFKTHVGLPLLFGYEPY